MKKLFLLLVLPLVLTSCFGLSSDNVNLTSYEADGFELQVPKAWTAVPPSNLPAPKKGSIALALTSTELTAGFANNILILKDTLNADADPTMNSRKYSIVTQALASGEYKEYTKLTDATVNFADKDTSLVTTFEAKYSDDTPKQKFLQTAKICGKDVYLMTIGLGLSTDSTDKYIAIFETFVCK